MPRAGGVSTAPFLPLTLALLMLASIATARSGVSEPIVLTQVPRQAHALREKWNVKNLARADWFEGARVVLVDPAGPTRMLSEGLSSACDPNVSFDGRHILFAGRKNSGTCWRIWEVEVDGNGLRAVTPETMDARSPIYAATLFTLDSPEPWLTTVFVGRDKVSGEAGQRGITSLYNIKLDGSELRRLTFNPNNHFDPFQTWDGRVLYAAERHPNQPGTTGGWIGLYAVHVEGADMERFGGELGQRVQQMPCVTPGGLVVFVESVHGTWDGAGQLACLEERRPHVTYRCVTKETSQLYLYPSPLRDNVILVSRRPAESTATCGVVRFDLDTGSSENVFDSPNHHDVQAVVVRPRPRPDGHSTVVDTKFDTGIIYGMNCYDTDPRMAPYFASGLVRRVRFLEGVPQPGSDKAKRPVPPIGVVPRRLVGEAPVEPDGSFNVEVPADAPLLLQALDARGLALATCGWIWVKPREKRGCIGCHEDPERTPENEYVLALQRPSTRLTLPASQRRSISFVDNIAPLLQQRCASAECHGKSTALRLPLSAKQPSARDLRRAYDNLVRPMAGTVSRSEGPPQPGLYLDAGRARTSWLVWQLMGTNTSRPWDQPATPVGPARKVSQMPPSAKGSPLAEEESQTIVQWIELGAPYATLPCPSSAKQPESSSR